MEFEEMKKLWRADSQETVYVINEQALHNRIIAKKKKTIHITKVTESLLISVNFFGCIFILLMTFNSDSGRPLLYLLAAWMLLTASYVFIKRKKRLNRQNDFGHSISEDLRNAVSTAGYQVELSALMRLNIIPLTLLCILGVWNKQNMTGVIIGISVVFGLAFYLSGWEHNYYRKRKYELEQLKKILDQE